MSGAPAASQALTPTFALFQTAAAVAASPYIPVVAVARAQTRSASILPSAAKDALFRCAHLVANAPRPSGSTYAQRTRDEAVVTYLTAQMAPIPDPLLAAVTSRARILLFAPSRDPARFEWTLVGDLLPALMLEKKVQVPAANAEPTNVDYFTAMSLETSALAWSELLVNLEFSPSKSTFFLSVGTKDGMIHIWRFSAANEPAKSSIYQKCIQLPTRWVSKIAWSQWFSAGPVQRAYILSSCADGSIYSYIVTYNSETEHLNAELSETLCEPDLKGISVLKFNPNESEQARCAICKSTTLLLWTASPPQTDNASLGKCTSLLLPMSFMPVGDISWSLARDEMRVYGVDGKVYAVAIVSGATSSNSDELVLLEDLTGQLAGEITGSTISAGNGVDSGMDGGGDADEVKDPNSSENRGATTTGSSKKQIRYYGAVSSASGLADVLLYTVTVAEGLSYLTDKSNTCTVSVHWNYLRGRNHAIEDKVLERILDLVNNNADLLFRVAPMYLLWDVVEFIKTENGNSKSEESAENNEENNLLDRLIDMLKQSFVLNHGRPVFEFIPAPIEVHPDL
ncbi:hypothetical protein HDU84_007605 [Entophlyctis sp. JEL0112]|nr:hypothetical protein HDU84_007605 [Entophlyctis sp. JEL0112]